MPAGLLSPAAAAGRWPGIAFSGSGPVVFHQEAGVIHPERGMAAMLRLATTRGARVHHGTPVTRVEAVGAGAVAHAADGSFAALR